MCLGLFLMREGMHRELKIATTVERVVVEAAEGRQVKIANIRGKEALFEGFSQVKQSQVPLPPGKSLSIRIEDPENPKRMYYEIEMGNAVICEQELLYGMIEGKYDSIDISEQRKQMIDQIKQV